MNYCDAVDGSPANYTFSFKGWYLIRLIITFSDNSTCQVYKYLNVNGSNMINCQPNPDEADVARPRVNINYSDPCYNSNNQLRGGLISFAGDPLAPCTNESKISYYLNYIDCDGVTHCDEPIGYTLGYSSCFNIAFGTVFIVEAVGNHCCYPDGYKRYLTIRYESILEDQDADPYAILITGNNCYDACTQWHANCTTGNWFYVDTIGVRTNHTGVNYPSSCSPYFTAGNDALQERERDNFENLYSDNLRFTGLEIEFGSSTEIQAVEIFDLLGRRIPGSFDISQNTYKLTERVNGVIIINLKTKNRNLVRKLIAF
jgi:hypothetical protein